MKRIWLSFTLLTGSLILLSWTIDTVFQYYFFDSDHSFLELFVTDLPKSVFYVRLLWSLLILILGFFMARMRIHLLISETESLKREEKYRLIASNTTDVIWTLNFDGRFTYISPSIKKLRGYDPEEVMLQSLEDSLTPESYATVKGLIERFMEMIRSEDYKQLSVVTDLEQPCKDGSTVWVEASVTTILGSDGKPDFFLGVSRDVSDRKKKEHDLRRSEENYRLLAETSLDFIMVCDMEGYITYANTAALRASGYSMDDVIGRKVYEIVPEKDLDMIRGFMEKRQSGNYQRFLYEIDFIHKSGRLIPVEISSAPIMLNKTPLALLITARDITGRREAEKILSDNEKRFRSYIENSPIPLFVIKKSGKILYTNDAAAEFLAYNSKEEVLLQNYSGLKKVVEHKGFTEFADVLASNGTVQEESVFIRKNGDEVNAIIKATVLDDENFLVYAIDISDRIVAEKRIRDQNREIRRLNSGLEEKVRIRTMELQEVNSELEAFSYSVSHDLRAPLRHISAFSRLLKPAVDISDERAVKYLSTIITSVEKMNTLIEDLLLFSRVGKAELHKREFEMTPLVKQIIAESEFDLNDREIAWDVEEMGMVYGDRNLLGLVWTNLIANSLKFTRTTESGRIQIGAKDGVFFINDNGVGFDPKYKDKLFGVFQRLHLESEFEGTGIGLANVKRIITRHGGEVYAEAVLKKGAKFSFSIPPL